MLAMISTYLSTPVPAPPMAQDGRRTGARVGLGVGLVFDLVAGILWLLSAPRLSDLGLALLIGVATPIAGLTSGRLLGKAAFAARGRLAWAGVVAGVAFFATVVGDVLIALGFGVGGAIANGTDPFLTVGSALVMTVAYAGLGILFVGPIVAPVTGVAALIWASIMARMSRRTSGFAT